MPSFAAASTTESFNAGNTSSRRISPGWVGGRARLAAMVILQIDGIGSLAVPFERHAPISCNPHRIAHRTKTFQRVKSKAGYIEITDVLAGIENRKNSLDARQSVRIHA